MIYTSSSLSLATLEVLVHLEDPYWAYLVQVIDDQVTRAIDALPT